MFHGCYFSPIFSLTYCIFIWKKLNKTEIGLKNQGKQNKTSASINDLLAILYPKNNINLYSLLSRNLKKKLTVA